MMYRGILRLVGLMLRVRTKNQFSYFSSKTYIVGTQKNRLNEKHMLKLMGKKILTLLRSKIVLI